MIKVMIEWRDHYSQYGWFPPEEAPAQGHINVSTGFLVGETDVYTTIAQTMHKDRDQYADLLHIITADITSYKELS